jgi:hypothetical protein
MEEKSLVDYLKIRKNESLKLESEIAFLESIKIPLIIRQYGDDYTLISENYSLATHVKIKDRSNMIGSFSCYDGGTTTILHKFYPQFYFKVKKGEEDIKILIQHPGFDNDNNIIIKSWEIMKGWGKYNSDFRDSDEYIDTKKVISYFENKGVQKDPIKKLETKIETFYDWAIKFL